MPQFDRAHQRPFWDSILQVNMLRLIVDTKWRAGNSPITLIYQLRFDLRLKFRAFVCLQSHSKPSDATYLKQTVMLIQDVLAELGPEGLSLYVLFCMLWCVCTQ